MKKKLKKRSLPVFQTTYHIVDPKKWYVSNLSTDQLIDYGYNKAIEDYESDISKNNDR